MSRAAGGAAGGAGKVATLSVFMEGTANPMDTITTQIALFDRLCVGTVLPVDGSGQSQANAPGHYKVSFEGCGVTLPVQGTLFATGLREQCAVIKSYVDSFISAGVFVKINFVGLSRGGIGGCYLAQELSDYSRDKVVLNMLLFDPVPGNLVWMARIDLLGLMNANRSMDVSSCKVLDRVVVLYPHEPLPDIAFHAPVLPTFPEGCQVDQDVILGCHQGALWLHSRADTCLAFARIRDFLIGCGSQLDRAKNVAPNLDVSEQTLANMLEGELRQTMPTTRCAHSKQSGVEIVRHSRGTYLNRSHEALLARLGNAPRGEDEARPKYMLDFA
mmetsp:Transcript_60338/g.156736  ORF Transcript_60338/g.156736 Transcript_60338/m.156736 type:complete len:330 (-) Transcript_60338:140-1129(-)